MPPRRLDPQLLGNLPVNPPVPPQVGPGLPVFSEYVPDFNDPAAVATLADAGGGSIFNVRPSTGRPIFGASMATPPTATDAVPPPVREFDGDFRRSAQKGSKPLPQNKPQEQQQQAGTSTPPAEDYSQLAGLTQRSTQSTTTTENYAKDPKVRKAIAGAAVEADAARKDLIQTQQRMDLSKMQEMRRMAAETRAQADSYDNNDPSYMIRRGIEKQNLDKTLASLEQEENELGNFEAQPGRFLNKMTGFQKAVFMIGSTLGAALEGARMGLQGQGGPNAMVSMLENLIERDMMSQERQAGRKRSKLDRNWEVYNSLRNKYDNEDEARMRMRGQLYAQADQVFAMLDRLPGGSDSDVEKASIASARAAIADKSLENAVNLAKITNPGSSSVTVQESPAIDINKLLAEAQKKGELTTEARNQIHEIDAGRKAFKSYGQGLKQRLLALGSGGNLNISKWFSENEASITADLKVLAKNYARMNGEKGGGSDVDQAIFQEALGVGTGSWADIFRSNPEVAQRLIRIIDGADNIADERINAWLTPDDQLAAEVRNRSALRQKPVTVTGPSK